MSSESTQSVPANNVDSVLLELSRCGLSGNIADENTENVSFQALVDATNALKYVTTRNSSRRIQMILYSAENAIIPIRTLICDHPIAWQQIQTLAEKNLKNSQKLIPEVLPELEFVSEVASDRLLCAACESALVRNGPRGSPENLNISDVNTLDLDSICESINSGTACKTEKANQLTGACKIIKNIRENLLKIKAKTSSMAIILECYRQIKSLVLSAYKTHKANHTDAAWGLIKEEVTLTIRAAHIYEIRSRIEECVMAGTRIYNKNAASTNASAGGDTPKPQLRRQSMLTTKTDNMLTCIELDNIIDAAYKMDMISNILGPYISCAQGIRKIRNCVIDYEWDTLRKLKDDEGLQRDLMIIPAANKELTNALQEYYNKETQEKLERLLKREIAYPLAVISPDDVSSNNTYFTLAGAISDAELVTITSVYTNQLLDCARRVVDLRRELSSKHCNIESVTESLQWLQKNGSICPPSVRAETNDAAVYHMNNLLIKGLLEAFQTGSATGTIEDRITHAIDTTQISKLLGDATRIPKLHPEAKELVELAEIIYAIRCAQRAQDYPGLKNSMKMLATMKNIHPLVIDEVSAARGDIENYAIVQVLSSAISAFDDDAPPMDTSVESLDFLTPAKSLFVNNSQSNRGTVKVAGAVKGRRYSYVNMNCSDIDKDTVDVDILKKALAKVESYGVHTFSIEARRLYRTVKLLQLIRQAMKDDDWDQIKQIIDELENRGTINSSGSGRGKRFGRRGTRPTPSEDGRDDNAVIIDGLFPDDVNSDNSIDVLADKEIQVVHAQLQMRNTLADVRKYVGLSGSAKCCYGLVDTDSLLAKELYNAAEKAIRSFEQEQHLTSQQTSKKGSGDVSGAGSKKPFGSLPVAASPTPTIANLPSDSSALTIQNEDTKLLLTSAKYLASVRMSLSKGNHEEAGVLAEKLINATTSDIPIYGNDGSPLPSKLHPDIMDELYLYATEVGEALVANRICRSLLEVTMPVVANAEEHIDEHVEVPSLQSIVDVTENAVMERNGELWDMDLGLVCLLDASLNKLEVLSKLYSYVLKLMKKTNIKQLKEAIDTARANNISSILVEKATAYLEKLEKLEKYVAEKCILCGGGIVIGEENHRDVLKAAVDLKLESHLLARRSSVFLKFEPSSLRVANIIRAIEHGNMSVIVSQTMAAKRSFLSLESSQSSFRLEKFPMLRDADDFGMRMTLKSGELRDTMLYCSEKSIPTSLCRLPPALSALAVYIFGHCIRPLQQQVFATPCVLLRNLLQLGRYYVPIRDELYMQIIKQLRNNQKLAECRRLWRVLGACLKHFPPSAEFENYVESFLINCYETNCTMVTSAPASATGSTSILESSSFSTAALFLTSKGKKTTLSSAIQSLNDGDGDDLGPEDISIKSAAYHCIQSMHESIIRYGYGERISSMVTVDGEMLSLEQCERWLMPMQYGIDLVRIDHRHAESKSSIPTEDRNVAVADNEHPSSLSRLNSNSNTNSNGTKENNVKTQMDKSRIDELNTKFVLYDRCALDRCNELKRMPHRGSKANWQKRFLLFSGNKTKVTCDLFVDLMCNFNPVPVGANVMRPSATGGGVVEGNVDRKDYQVFMLIVCGQSVIHRNGLIREYLHDGNNYVANDASVSVIGAQNNEDNTLNDSAASWLVAISEIRRNLLRKLVYPPKRKLEDKQEASKQFWKRVVEPVIVASEIAKANQEQYLKNKQQINDENKTMHMSGLLTSSTTPSRKDSLKRQNLEVLYDEDANPTNNTPQAKNSVLENEKKKQEHSIGWDIYRDIVLAGVEWLIDSETEV